MRAFLARLLAAMDPRRHWIGIGLFLLALLIGAVASALWMRAHRAQPASATTETIGQTPDATHPPLPAPMPGGLASMPAEVPTAPNAAYIKAEPTPPPPAAASVALPGQETVAGVEDSEDASIAASSSGDTGPQLIRRTQPQYPPEALRSHEEGSVQLQIVLDAQGGISDVQLIRSSRSRALDRAAMDAVRDWQFRPAIMNGVRAPSTMTETVDFRLNGN